LIQLNRPNCPPELTKDVKKELIQKFIQTGENVWAKPYIKEALLKMSYNKCSYCECKLDEESKYMEVEHFLPKDDYPNLVVEWDNLLPSCKRCNVRKRKHDPLKEPIINPVQDKPNEHIKMFNYWLKGIDEKGKMTVDILYLNQLDRLVHPRMEFGVQTIKTIEILLQKAEKFIGGSDNSGRNRSHIVNGTLQLLTEAQPQSQYSSTVASILFSNEDFFKLKEIMTTTGLWDEEHQALIVIAEKNILVQSLQKIAVS
jgi:uncharacterized protein (TIGR02646 family)